MGASSPPPLSADAAAPLDTEACRDECLTGGSCASDQAGALPTLAQSYADWEVACSAESERRRWSVFEARCADGVTMLQRSNGLVVEQRYFDQGGALLGRTRTSDNIDEICEGRRYWPKLIECDDAVVTRVACSGLYPVSVGQKL